MKLPQLPHQTKKQGKIWVSEIRNTFGTFIYVKQNICRKLEVQISEKFKRFFFACQGKEKTFNIYVLIGIQIYDL